MTARGNQNMTETQQEMALRHRQERAALRTASREAQRRTDEAVGAFLRAHREGDYAKVVAAVEVDVTRKRDAARERKSRSRARRDEGNVTASSGGVTRSDVTPHSSASAGGDTAATQTPQWGVEHAADRRAQPGGTP